MGRQYDDKLEFTPSVDPQKLVRYYDLELGRERDPAAQKFAELDFFYRGIFEIGVDACATVQAYENSYIIDMDQCPQGLGPVSQATQSGTG